MEDFAFQYVNLSQSGLRGVWYGLAVVGGIVGGITNRSSYELQRSPYFAYLMLILLGSVASQYVWLNGLAAMAKGYLGALVAVDFAAALFAGFFTCRIAIARSRDAVGHGRYAALAFIPVANLALLFWRSKNEVSANRSPAIPILAGGSGVAWGVLMLVVAVLLNVFLMRELERQANAVAAAPETIEEQIEAMISTQGLEATLQAITAEVPVPQKVDEVTTLTRVVAKGTELWRIYVVALEDVQITNAFRADVQRNICQYALFKQLIAAGASVHESYLKDDNSPIGDIVVSRAECAAYL